MKDIVNSCYLFNDPLEDTEMFAVLGYNGSGRSYLFNDPLEDTEICGAGQYGDKLFAVTCSTIR